jgi:tripartite-type tricarboxylate transporter receptor subunit TctC
MKRILWGFALLCISFAAHAQYPNKPVRVVVPFPAGSSTDIITRVLTNSVSQAIGQQLVVDNKAGADGAIAAADVAKAAPDGYTLLLISVAHAFNPAIYKKLPYDPEKAFVPIGIVAAGPVALMVHPAVPVRTVKELIDLAKAKPGQLNYATAGIGSFQHLASELFKLQTGVDMVHVPYKGGGPAMMDTIAGQAQVNMASLIQVGPHVKSGKLRLVATSGTRRSSLFPDVPTVAETVAGYDATNWWGLIAPAGTPQPVIAKLSMELEALLKSDETKKRMESEGADIVRMTPAEFGRFIADETQKWAKVVKQAGITAE